MSDHDPLIELLALWEERRHRGEDPTAEELCPDDLTLQEHLRQRIQKRRRLLQAINLMTVSEVQGQVLAPTVPLLRGYEIQDVLGSGGMGVVYRARQLALNRTVAVKMVLGGVGSSAADLPRFQDEAKTIASLQHPNIVQIHEVGDLDGRPYLVMEYVEGGSLAQFLNRTPLAPQRAAQLLHTLALAVQHAHEHGIVHRDLKPANILLSQHGTPKVADFGLAKRVDDQSRTRTGTVLGTPQYMAPEQALGRTRDVGPSTDIYALGVILYEMLTGRVPFVGETLLETLEQVRTSDPVPPQQLVPKLPKDLDTLCLKCLQKDPDRRYASAADLALDLQHFLDGDAISARPDTVFEQFVRALLRNQRDFPLYTTWSRLYLAVAPFPTLIHLLLILFFQHERYFPQLAVLVSMCTVILGQTVLLRGVRTGLQHLPIALRRQTRIVFRMVTVANLLVLFAVWWQGPADQPERLLRVYPMMALVAGTAFFSFAGEFGWFFVTGSVTFFTAFLMILFPIWSPFTLGLLMTFNIGSFGIFFYRLGQRAKKEPRTK